MAATPEDDTAAVQALMSTMVTTAAFFANSVRTRIGYTPPRTPRAQEPQDPHSLPTTPPPPPYVLNPLNPHTTSPKAPAEATFAAAEPSFFASPRRPASPQPYSEPRRPGSPGPGPLHPCGSLWRARC